MPEAEAAQPWHSHTFAYCRGAQDTRIKTGEDYPTRTLAALWTMEPDNKAKASGLAMIPSTYADYDARSHQAQRERGRFIALCGDVDSGNHDAEVIETAVEAFTQGAAWLTYTSAHSRPDDTRWRIVLPLAETVPFNIWHDAQKAFFAFMEARGIEMDHALARPGQLVYLPNVPAMHKSGTALRDDNGKPLYFERGLSSMSNPGLALDQGPVAEGIAAIRRQRAADETERARLKAEAERRRANKPAGNGASLIDDFNAANTVAAMLEQCGYEQCPRHDDDWRSPQQTGETYATRVIGSKWVSLSQSDAASGLGEKCSAGCYGDAFDLFAHYKFGGDRKAALRQLGAERRADNVIYPAQFDAAPPDWMSEISDYDEAPEWLDQGEPDVPELSPNAPEPPELHENGLPLPTLDLAALSAIKPVAKAFMVERIAPVGEVTLFTGPGSAGKSLFSQQLATCAAAGVDCLGLKVMGGPAIYMTCEDDAEQLHWRQDAICRSLRVPMASLVDKLHLISLRGALDNELGTFGNDGQMKPAQAYHRLVAMIQQTGATLAILDNVAHLFTGNENDRGEVTRFVNLLNRLAGETGASIMLIGHPNKAGDDYSGSTAWLNAVRSQATLQHDLESDVRTIAVGKANYAQKGDTIRFVWCEGAFVLEDALEPSQREQLVEVGKANHENEAFLRCLRARNAQGVERGVGASPGPSYAPSQFEGMAEAKGVKRQALKVAMDRLFAIGKIETRVVERPGKAMKKSIIVEVA